MSVLSDEQAAGGQLGPGRRNPTYAPFATVDDAILAAVGRFHYLTSTQLCRRFWQMGSLTAMRAKTKELADHGLLDRVLTRRTARAGSAPLVYTLGAGGRRRLRRLGVPLGRDRPGEREERSELFLAHTLALNDVLISAERLGLADDGVELVGLRHERELKRTPLASAHGQVIPDAWLGFHVQEAGHWLRDYFLVELDRGTEGMRAVRTKVARLATLDMDSYAHRLDTTNFSGFLLVATSGPRRLVLLRQWIQDELLVLGCPEAAELFYLTAHDAAALTPADFFRGTHWVQPFASTARPPLGG